MGIARPSALALAFMLPAAAAAHDCAGIADDGRRLECYDKAFGRPAPAVPVDRPAAANPPAIEKATGTSETRPSTRGRTLASDWDLDPGQRRERFELRAYKPMYLLFATNTSHVNREPSSPSPGHTVPGPIPISETEAQYQISFRTKVAENLMGDRGNLWLGYTQSSRWQVYNGGLSRPFRETNYEPEVMFVMPASFQVMGWQAKMTSLSLNHQSNGRSLPFSRSWNRIIGQVGLEKGDTMLLVRPWVRIPEQATDDDNPGIENYLGRGEVVLSRRIGEHVVSFQGRHSLRLGSQNRGSAKVDWSIPISGALKAHLSLFTGYGESMIDYNHRQTVLGVGFSLVEWR